MLSPRIAFVHEWLINVAGSEQVLAEMLKVFPDADLYAVIDFLNEDEKDRLGKSPIRTTFIQKLPFAKSLYKFYLILMPMAIERLDMSKYDIVISSSHAVAKGVKTTSSQLHICMCYSPMRYIWDMQDEYLATTKLDKGFRGWLIKLLFTRLRKWDVANTSRVDKFIAISDFIAQRIKKVYNRSSDIIYPPINIANFPLQTEKDDYYLALSRMVPYKRIDLIVKAFTTMPDKKLVVIGDGPELGKIRNLATANITILGYQTNNMVNQYLSRARALVFAAKEDFGIVLVEAQACGTPVIAYAEGGASEIVNFFSENEHENINATGVAFKEQTVNGLCRAVMKFEKFEHKFNAITCRENAERFNTPRFQNQFKQFVDQSWDEFNSQQN